MIANSKKGKNYMGRNGKKPVTKEEIYNRKCEIMEQCYECYAEKGFHGTGIKALAENCGCTSANLYVYFENIDDLIIQSTEYCMSKVENDFMMKAPKNADDLENFIDKVPYWTAKKHGKKYRLMYQIYTHPKYRESGKKFFEGVNERYSEYAKTVAKKIGLPDDVVRPMIFTFVRACVHYALYEDEFYLQEQLKLLKQGIKFYREYLKEKPEQN